MEIACLVRARIPATLKNTKLAEKCLQLVREREVHRAKEWGNSWLFCNEHWNWHGKGNPCYCTGKDQRKIREVPKKKQTAIRAMLGDTAKVLSSKKQQNEVEGIEID